MIGYEEFPHYMTEHNEMAKEVELTIAIGDIHGCFSELLSLMSHIQRETIGHVKRFVFLGDYTDRGLGSREVLDYLIDLDNKIKDDPKEDEHIFIRGNHDDMLIKHNKNFSNYQDWIHNGGDATLQGYYKEGIFDKAHFAKHVEWITNRTVLFYKDKQRTYVHAGFYRKRPIEKQHADILMWIREEFYRDLTSNGGYVVHGHTPGSFVDLQPYRCNLDTGCVYGYRHGITGGILSAGIFNNEQASPIKLIDNSGKVTIL